MRRVGVFLATACGAGYFPFAPGTAGSLVGLALYFISRDWTLASQATLLGLVVVVGTWASSEAAKHFNREDPGHVVIDEVAGQLVTLFMLGTGVLGAFVGFLIFRAFDIVKPWPARRLEDLPGGIGIMADDVMAGIYGWITMRIVLEVSARIG